MDIALSPDGMKIMVSFLWPDQSGIQTRVGFYNFDSIGQTEENNQVSLLTYDGVVAPSVYFVDERRSVVLRSNGFSVCQGAEIPTEKVSVDFDEEILTAFHDDGKIGFIFKSDKADYKYKDTGLQSQRPLHHEEIFEYGLPSGKDDGGKYSSHQ